MLKNWYKILAFILAVYFFDVYVRERLAARRARQLANKLNKPLLNVGSGTNHSSFTGAKLRGDVNCDLAASQETACGPQTVCHCDVQDLSRFKDKEFGAILVANVLQYVSDKEKAMQEFHRVADKVIIADNFFPWMQLGPGNKFRFQAKK
jgi:ubiquinone/menaquinone biosynthesis C-methylase UbiE